MAPSSRLISDHWLRVGIADARPVVECKRYLNEAVLSVELIELHDEALADLVCDIQLKLLGAELMIKLKKLDLPSVNFDEAKALAQAAAKAVKAGRFGYALLKASKPVSNNELLTKPSPIERLPADERIAQYA